MIILKQGWLTKRFIKGKVVQKPEASSGFEPENSRKKGQHTMKKARKVVVLHLFPRKMLYGRIFAKSSFLSTVSEQFTLYF